MILLLDENMPAKVADALSALGTVTAHHVTRFLPRGATDLEIFEFLREQQDWVLVTQDRRITKRPQELAALRDARVGAFVFTGKADRSLEQSMQLVLDSLPQMRRHVAQATRPFVFGISDRRRFERLV